MKDFFQIYSIIWDKLSQLGVDIGKIEISAMPDDTPMLQTIMQFSEGINIVAEANTEKPWTHFDRLFSQVVCSCELPKEDRACGICLLPFKSTLNKTPQQMHGDVYAIVVGKCGHLICDKCLREWINGTDHSTCPYCRHDIWKEGIARSLSIIEGCSEPVQAIIYQLDVLKGDRNFTSNEELQINPQKADGQWLMDEEWINILADLHKRLCCAKFHADPMKELDYLWHRTRAVIRGLSWYIKLQELPDELRVLATSQEYRYNNASSETDFSYDEATEEMWNEVELIVRLYEKELELEEENGGHSEESSIDSLSDLEGDKAEDRNMESDNHPQPPMGQQSCHGYTQEVSYDHHRKAKICNKYSGKHSKSCTGGYFYKKLFRLWNH